MRSGTINSASKAQNKTQRLEFVKYWADYVRTHPDKDWSKQQVVLIDSMLDGAQELSKKKVQWDSEAIRKLHERKLIIK